MRQNVPKQTVPRSRRGLFRFALRTTKGVTDTAIRGTATTCRRTESRGPIRPKFRFHAPPRPEHEPAAILESATRCLTLSPAAPPRSYRHKAALSPTLANELLGILHPYRIVILLYESYPISERHRIIPTASVIRRPLPAATGRVYNSDPPLNPLLGGDFGRYAPKEDILEVHRIYNYLISAGTCCVATKTSNRIPLSDCGNPDGSPLRPLASSPLRGFTRQHRHLILYDGPDREAPSNKNSER